MLYITTRSRREVYTSDRPLSEDRAPDGGLFVPAAMPAFDRKQIKALGDNSFAGNVAAIINLLFDTSLDSWAVEFAIGRYPANMVKVSGRAIIAETWHNPVWRFDRLVRGVEKAIRQSDQIMPVPSDWLTIGARIAVLFGIFGELIREGEVSSDNPLDVAVASGDFSALLAAWYAREWGLPIETIICGSNENPAAWNLLHKGELRTDSVAVKTATPECDQTLPKDLERLIYHTLGQQETLRYLEACRQKANYYLERSQTDQLRKGIQVSVVSASRMEATAANLYRNSHYIADPYTALVYSALIDCRSRTGVGRNTLIISDESPVFSLDLLSRCLGKTTEELQNEIETT